MFAVAIAGAVLAATGIVWSRANQREKETELLFIGNQFRQAIALYYQRAPGASKRYPPKIENLIKDERYLTTQRYLRKVYIDPMTGKAQWGLVMAPEGGVMGVYSLSTAKPIKYAGFAKAEGKAGFANATRYTEWRFTYVPNSLFHSTLPPPAPAVALR
ncbi:MAG: type II secretion system protein [Actinomycetota bacterium]